MSRTHLHKLVKQLHLIAHAKRIAEATRIQDVKRDHFITTAQAWLSGDIAVERFEEHSIGSESEEEIDRDEDGDELGSGASEDDGVDYSQPDEPEYLSDPEDERSKEEREANNVDELGSNDDSTSGSNERELPPGCFRTWHAIKEAISVHRLQIQPRPALKAIPRSGHIFEVATPFDIASMCPCVNDSNFITCVTLATKPKNQLGHRLLHNSYRLSTNGT